MKVDSALEEEHHEEVAGEDLVMTLGVKLLNLPILVDQVLQMSDFLEFVLRE